MRMLLVFALVCVGAVTCLNEWSCYACTQASTLENHSRTSEKVWKTPVLRLRFNEILNLSVLDKWNRVNIAVDQTDGSKELIETKERDLLVKLLRLTNEETRKLDEAFEERSKKRERSSEALGTLVSQEAMELLAYEQGESPRLDTSSYLASTPEKVNKLFDTFVKEELASEEKLIEILNVEFDPTQRSELFKRWIHLNNLHILFSQSHLQLSEEQADAVRLAVEKFKETQKKLEGEYLKGLEGTPNDRRRHNVGQSIVRSSQWHRDRFNIVAHLTPDQFRECVHLIHADPKYRRASFKDLLKWAEERSEKEDEYQFIAKLDLEILGPIYREGARLEETRRTKR